MLNRLLQLALSHCRQVRRLELKSRHYLDVGVVLGAEQQAEVAPSLRELHLLAEEGLTGAGRVLSRAGS